MSSSVSEPMTSAQRAIWAVVCLVIVVIVVARSFVGLGMGRVYVEPTPMDFVAEVSASADGESESTVDWKQLPPAEFAAYVTANPGTETIRWVEYDQVPPRSYFAQETAGVGGPIVFSWPRTIGLWLAAFFTLAIFSFLYRDNPFYKFAESVVVGVSAGYWMVVGFWDTIVPNLLQRLLPAFSKEYLTPGMELPAGGFEMVNLVFLIPLVLGLMLICRLLPKCGWMSLWPLAFIVGTMAGLRMVSYIESDILVQTKETVIPLYVQGENTSSTFMLVWTTIWASLAQILLVIGVLACLVYFFFSVEHKGVVGKTARVGIWYLMITFGAAFGFTVMGRIALLAARVEFLFDDWMWLIDPMQQREFVTASVGLLF